MSSSVSGQDEPNLALWLATRAGKMELSCPLGIRALSRKYNLSCFGVLSHIINPLLTKLVRSITHTSMSLNVIKKLSLPEKCRRKLLVWIFTCLSITFCKFTSGTYRLMLNNGPNYLNNKNVCRRWRWEGERSKLRWNAHWVYSNAFQMRTMCIQMRSHAHGVHTAVLKRAMSTFKRLQPRIECIETLSNVREVF